MPALSVYLSSPEWILGGAWPGSWALRCPVRWATVAAPERRTAACPSRKWTASSLLTAQHKQHRHLSKMVTAVLNAGIKFKLSMFWGTNMPAAGRNLLNFQAVERLPWCSSGPSDLPHSPKQEPKPRLIYHFRLAPYTRDFNRTEPTQRKNVDECGAGKFCDSRCRGRLEER
jgi:hypothetical protein